MPLALIGGVVAIAVGRRAVSGRVGREKPLRLQREPGVMGGRRPVIQLPPAAAPHHADAHRLLVLHRDLDHGAEVVVVLAADADVAGVDAVLGEGAGALGIFLQQQMSVVMEIADDGDADTLFVELLGNGRDGGRGLLVVDRDSNQLGACAGQGCDLLDS